MLDVSFDWKRQAYCSSNALRQNIFVKCGTPSRYVNLRIAHAPGMHVTFPRHRLQRKPLVSDPSMSASLTRDGGETFPHSRRRRNPQICVSDKRPWLGYDKTHDTLLTIRPQPSLEINKDIMQHFDWPIFMLQNALVEVVFVMIAMASQITSIPTVCLVVYSGTHQRKHPTSALLACVRGFNW